MVHKLFIKLILLIALTSCGYSPIYSSLEDQRLNIEILEFKLRLKGKRTIPTETFKDIVMLQDQLYNRDASKLAPRIFDYVY